MYSDAIENIDNARNDQGMLELRVGISINIDFS